MATPKPGEIRCPTCHRSTPPATFCTQCGTAIPPDARVRPRGLDRDELQERIHARRFGGDPYRRGGSTEDGLPAYERFEPEPEDRAARHAGTGGAEPRRDLLPETPLPISRPQSVPPMPVPLDPYAEDRDNAVAGTAPWSTVRDEPVDQGGWGQPAGSIEPEPLRALDRDDPRYAMGGGQIEEIDYDEPGYEPGYAPEYEEWEERRERGSVAGGILGIVGFLVLGILALGAGAVVAGLFSNSGVGSADETSEPTLSVVASASANEASATPDATPSVAASASADPGAGGDPVVFPDGFTAEVQPCLPGTAKDDGCGSSGSRNGGSVVVWVGFSNGAQGDVLSAQVVRADGGLQGTGTMDLARLGCRGTCDGWTYFPFDGLSPGTYEVRVTRNGEPAGETTFEVS